MEVIFKKIDKENLPKYAVLATDGLDSFKFGFIYMTNFGNIYCESCDGDIMYDATHYILYTSIKFEK